MALKYATRTSPQIKSQCRSTNYTSMATKEGGGGNSINTKSSIPVRSSKGPTNQELSKIEMEIGWVGSDRVGPAQFTS